MLRQRDKRVAESEDENIPWAIFLSISPLSNYHAEARLETIEYLPKRREAILFQSRTKKRKALHVISLPTTKIPLLTYRTNATRCANILV